MVPKLGMMVGWEMAVGGSVEMRVLTSWIPCIRDILRSSDLLQYGCLELGAAHQEGYLFLL
jgi:hypothetical protein